MDRRIFLGGLAAAVAAAPARGAAAPLRLLLLGQSLIQHDLCAAGWPELALDRLLHAQDLVFSDLETAVDAAGAGAPTRAPLLLHRASPGALDCLKAAGVGVLATANNHAWDLGTGGVTAALAALDGRALAHAGSGRDLADAARAAVVATPAGRVAVVAAATGAIREGAAATGLRPGVNELRRRDDGLEPEDLSRVLASVSQAARSGTLVLFYHHNHDWGADSSVPPVWQRRLARQAIEAGAGLFVSHGAPRLQGVEVWRGAPIFYDLGNFIFQTRTTDDRYGPEAWEGVAVACLFDGGRFRRAAFTPLALDAEGLADDPDMAKRGRPSLAHGAEARSILARLADRSTRFGAALSIHGETAVLTP